jgi:RNA polymerase sigma factor (sigma-70 family)
MNSEPLRRLLGLARRTADPTDDAGLLARFAATADADAFELLVWRHGGMVLGVARRILGDVHAAEDAFQATFLALARQAKSVRRDGCVTGWLHRVAQRVAKRARHKRARQAQHERRAAMPGVCESSPPTADLRAVLDEELDRLPERFRRPVVLCYLEGRSTAEAAERLGCPRGTILSRLATAREKLRARLLRRGVTPAIIPPLFASPPVIRGMLINSTVRVAVANTAAPPVIDLCEGVIRTMILSKLKMTAAVVISLGLIGGGAGWMAMTPGGPGLAVAGPQAKADPPRPDATQEQQRVVAAQAERLHRELARAEEQMVDQEETWAKKRIDARLRLADAEEKYKRLERTPQPDRSQVLTAENVQIEQIRQAIENAVRASTKGEKEPHVGMLRKQLEEAQERAKARAKEAELQQAELAERILQARREMVDAEEQLSLFDRLTALKRRAAQAQIEDLQDRIRQLHGWAGQPDAADRRIRDVERKLDDVLRDLTELRRDLKK